MSASVAKPDSTQKTTDAPYLTDHEKKERLKHFSQTVRGHCNAGCPTKAQKKRTGLFSSFEKRQLASIKAWKHACQKYNKIWVGQNLLEDQKILSLARDVLCRKQDMGQYATPASFPLSPKDIDSLFEVLDGPSEPNTALEASESALLLENSPPSAPRSLSPSSQATTKDLTNSSETSKSTLPGPSTVTMDPTLMTRGSTRPAMQKSVSFAKLSPNDS